jgi:hypothetical protein
VCPRRPDTSTRKGGARPARSLSGAGAPIPGCRGSARRVFKELSRDKKERAAFVNGWARSSCFQVVATRPSPATGLLALCCRC